MFVAADKQPKRLTSQGMVNGGVGQRVGLDISDVNDFDFHY